MTNVAEKIEHEVSIEDILLKILRELKLQTLIMQEAFDAQDINKEDLEG